MKNKKKIRVVFMLLLIGILLVEVVSTKQVVNRKGSYQTNLAPQESQAFHTEPSIEIHESIIVGTVTDVEEILPALEPTTNIKQEYVDICIAVGKQYDIKPELLVALIEAESDGKKDCISPHGAMGLMQVVPGFHQKRMQRLGTEDLFDPWQNIECGTDYLSALYRKENDMGIALVGYNKGPDSMAYKRAVNHGELTNYAKQILERFNELEKQGLRGK